MITTRKHQVTFAVGNLVKFFDSELGPFEVIETEDIPEFDQDAADTEQMQPRDAVGHHQWITIIGGDWYDNNPHKYSGAFFYLEGTDPTQFSVR